MSLFKEEPVDGLDRLIEESARVLAGAAVPEGLEERLKMRSFAMNAAALDTVLEFPAVTEVPGSGLRAGRVVLFGSLGVGRATARDQRSFLGAALLHAAAVALIAIGVHAATRTPVLVKPVELAIVLPPPPVVPPAPARTTAAAGGGGHTGKTAVSRGTPPPFAPLQIVAPDQPRVEQPKMAVAPTVTANLNMQRTEALEFGAANVAPTVGMSLGNGRGTGIGVGAGDGAGPGGNGGAGGGLSKIGGRVSAPVVLYAPEAEFSEEARKQKVGGNVLVYLEVDTAGRPVHVRVMRGIGLGLDEQAVAAVKQYKFKPAMEGGKAVPVPMTVEVNFTIY